MKIEKGEPGYIRAKKRQETGRTLLEFAIVIAVFVTGYLTTKTRMNLLTVAAVLGCLPASRGLVGVIMLLPHRSFAEERVREIEAEAKSLVRAYDMIITSYEKIMPIDSIVILGNVVCGYAGSGRTDSDAAARYLKKMLANNRYGSVSVKIFTDYHAYVSRVKGLERMAEVGKEQVGQHEEGIRQVIISLSM